MSERRSTRSDIVGAFAAGLIVIVFCLLLLWHNPRVFWNDDYQLSILPVFADVARSWNEGHFPLLSPYSWVCSNLAGEFEYGTFSIFVNAAVVLIWRFPLTFPQQAAALSITHLFVLAAGAFLLARDRRLSIPLSIFVALVATLNGWIICWGATDWFGALSAFAWLPCAWWSLERALASTSSRCLHANHRQHADATRTTFRFLWPALFVYLLVTGGFPYTVVMLLVLIVWLSIKSLVQTRSLSSILPMLVGAALGFGLSAPAWLAIIDYVRGSARELQPASAHWQWLVPPTALPGIIVPCWTVNWIDFLSRHVPHTGTELACGLVAPSTILAGFIWRPRLLLARLKWEFILLGLLLLLSMIPTAGLFRWSFRWLPFFHLVLALCAAEILRLRPRSPTASMSVLLLIAVTIPMSILRTAGNYGVDLMLIYFQIAVIWVVGEWFLRDRWFREWAPAAATFAFLLATYLCIPPNDAVPKFNLDQKLTESAPLDPQRLYLSIYPQPEFEYRIEKKPGPIGQIVRPGSTSMWAGLRFINGYSPIRPAGVAREFYSYIHGEIDLAVGNYLLKEQSGPAGELARLGIDGIVVAKEVDVDPQPASEWELAFSSDEGRVFHRRGPPFLTVRSVTSLDPESGEQFSVATISRIDDSRNRVTVDVDVPSRGKPGLITFSRPYFRGYKARLNDQELSVDSYRGLMPMVKLPPGSRGRVVLSYQPSWLIGGGALSIFSAAICLVAVVYAASARKP